MTDSERLRNVAELLDHLHGKERAVDGIPTALTGGLIDASVALRRVAKALPLLTEELKLTRQLLVCYRLGRSPSGKLLSRLATIAALNGDAP